MEISRNAGFKVINNNYNNTLQSHLTYSNNKFSELKLDVAINASVKPKAAKSNWQGMLEETVLTTGFSINRLAQELKLATQTVHNLITGKTKHPRNLTFRKVLSFYCAHVYLQPAKGEAICSF